MKTESQQIKKYTGQQKGNLQITSESIPRIYASSLFVQGSPVLCPHKSDKADGLNFKLFIDIFTLHIFSKVHLNLHSFRCEL